MASKNIKGITIEIGGNTTKLQDALKGVSKTISSTNSEIKQLNQALKIDPKNITLWSQKQEVLKTNIEATKQKLDTLKEAQKQMGSYKSLTDEQKESYRALSVEISKSESALKSMKSQLQILPGINLDTLKNGLKKVGETAARVAADIAKKMTQVSLAVGGALAGLVTAGVKSYADYEQNLGGVQTLFGESANKVAENAKKAFETAGVSANEYMEGVTSFSASLLQSLGGDTDKAADIADMAFRDMSDNANKFGTDMSSIQNAYQGFAKQNYTMLDNLKLGYGGTKTEMERLLKDAEKFSGVKYDINNLSDVYNAIHVVQEELRITGTTADEAKGTISGSVTSMKAAFDNFLNGSGSPEQLATTITNVFRNISNAIAELAPDILNGVITLIQEVLPQISQLILDMLPQLLDAVTNMIDSILEMLTNNTENLSETIGTLVTKIVLFITENLPKIIEAAITILIALAEGIADNLDIIIPAIVKCVIVIIETLIRNLPKIIDAGIKLIQGLISGIGSMLGSLGSKIGEIGSIIGNELSKLPGKALNWGKDMLQGFIDGIKNKISGVVNAVKGVADKIKNFLHFSRPDEGPLREYETWMPDMMKGLAKSLNGSSYLLENATQNVAEDIQRAFSIDGIIYDVQNAMKGLNSKIATSINPVINPSVNYESNYNVLVNAFKDALSQMKVELDDEIAGAFVEKTVSDKIYS